VTDDHGLFQINDGRRGLIDKPHTAAQLRARVLAQESADNPLHGWNGHTSERLLRKVVKSVVETGSGPRFVADAAFRDDLDAKPGDLVFFGGGYTPHVARPVG
jgi:cell wall-associated NlpC family hydrolase